MLSDIKTAFEARKKRKLKQLYRNEPNKYARMLRVLKQLGMVVNKPDRKAYLKQWRLQNKERIRILNRKYADNRKQRLQAAKIECSLKLATLEQLHRALEQK